MYFSLYKADPNALMNLNSSQTNILLSDVLDNYDTIKILASDGGSVRGPFTLDQAGMSSGYRESPWIAVKSLKEATYVPVVEIASGFISIKRVGNSLAAIDTSSVDGAIIFLVMGQKLRRV